MLVKRRYLRGARFLLSDVPADVECILVELVAADGGLARGTMYRPAGTRPRVGALMMHPRMDQSQSYLLLPFVAAGYAALGCAGRFVNNDSAALQELLVLDVAAAVRTLHEAGCERVVLVGNSGGGALLSLYQAQARTAPADRLHAPPAGDGPDLGAHDLPPADALVLIGAHPGEGSRLAAWLDPSLTDEDDPLSIDPSLDMYDPVNGFRVPPEPSSYSAEFLGRFRAAQAARAARLDRRALDLLATRADAEARGDVRAASIPRHMLIHRVLASPAWLDTSIEPDDRDVGGFNNEPRPDLQNYEMSVATFLTPEAFLSTWSIAHTRADVYRALPSIPDPLLVVHYAGDAATHISEARRFLEVSAATDRQFVLVPGADHWGYTITGAHQRGPRTTEGTTAMIDWARARFPIT